MPIDLDPFKGKTLDDATLSELTAELTKHTEQLETRALKAEEKARKAAQESIDGRKGKDALLAKALEKLGVESPEDLDALPDAKGQAEAMKQFEIKLKRAERELAEKTGTLTDLTTRYAAERRERAIAEQVGKHPFIDAEDVRALVAARIRQEGDDLLFASADGTLVPLADGVAWIAKAKPHLVRPSGDTQQGSGYRGSKPGAGAKSIKKAEFDALKPAERAKAIADGFTPIDD